MGVKCSFSAILARGCRIFEFVGAKTRLVSDEVTKRAFVETGRELNGFVDRY